MSEDAASYTLSWDAGTWNSDFWVNYFAKLSNKYSTSEIQVRHTCGAHLMEKLGGWIWNEGKRLYGEHTLTLYWVSEPRSLVMWVISHEQLLQPCLSYVKLCSAYSMVANEVHVCYPCLCLGSYCVRRSLEKTVKEKLQGAWMWLMGDKKKRGRERMIRIKIKVLLLRKLGGFCLGSRGLLVCKEAEMEPTCTVSSRSGRRWEKS